MKQFLPFKEGAELFRWGPIPGRYFYMSEYEDAIFGEYLNSYKGLRWPNTLCVFKDKRMIWVNDFAELHQSGKDIFLTYIANKKSYESIKRKWLREVKKLVDFEKTIEDIYFDDLKDIEVYDLWNKFYGLIINFWLTSIPAELGYYGAEKLLEEKLSKIIGDRNEFVAVMEIITAPGVRSFYQQEEIDLALSKDIEKHAKKYFWIRNSYNGVEHLSIDFFVKRKKELSGNIKKLISERFSGLEDKKKKLAKNYNLSREIRNIAKAICAEKEWQDERKKHVLIYTYYKELFLKEVAKRSGYNIESLRNCSAIEVMQILEKRGVSMFIENRKNIFGFFMDPLKREIDGEEAEFCWDKYSLENNNLSNISANQSIEGDVLEEIVK